MQKTIFTLFTLILTVSGFSQDISGTWSGIIETGQKEHVIFVFHFEKLNENYSTVIAIPAKRIESLKPRATRFESGELTVDGSNLGFNYQGKFVPDRAQIEGIFTEGVNSFRLLLKRGESGAAATVKRPQEPLRLYPYREEEVTFANPGAGITLSGTLTLPETAGPFPAVVLISGSGPQDRDETFYEHKPFLVLADYLTRQGIAVLRYDDRGAGKSSGDHSLATTRDLASDVGSALDFLKSRNDIIKGKIGLIGHSEGAIIAPMVANGDKSVAFIVMLGGTGIPGSEVALHLAKTTRGFPVPDEGAYEAAIRKAIQIAGSDQDLTVIKKELRVHYNETIAPILKPLVKSDSAVEVIIGQLIEVRTSVWNRYFYHYNPAAELEQITCPVLALNGSKDSQVEAKPNQEGIRRALSKGAHPDFLVRELPGLNHLFQPCETGEMNEYSKIEQTMAPYVLSLISEWILAHAK